MSAICLKCGLPRGVCECGKYCVICGELSEISCYCKKHSPKEMR